MKRILGLALFASLLCFQSPSYAQESTVKKDVKHATKKVKHTAKKVGNETAEVASKGASKVVDKTYVDKVGPNGETIYINRHSKYYYVDEKGKHVFVTKAQMRNK